MLPNGFIEQIISNAGDIFSGIKIPFYIFAGFWIILGVLSIFNKNPIDTKEDATIEALDDLNDNFNTYDDYDD